MKILVYGSRGWIGSQFVSLLKQKEIDFVCGKSRIHNIEDVENEFEQVKPTNVISFIGRTHGVIDGKSISTIDYLEHKGKLKENVRDNLYSPVVLSMLCHKKNIHYVYLGTGCIFKYNKHFTLENGVKEKDDPNFYGSSYSTVKGYTDLLLKNFFKENVLNLRIRMPITAENNPRNFITKITKYEKVCSIANSMTVLPELLPYIIDMMENKTVGTINFTNPGVVTHNEILEMYKEIVDPSFTWKNFTEEEQNTILKSERSNNYMNTDKLEQMYPEILDIKSSIRQCLENFKR